MIISLNDNISAHISGGAQDNVPRKKNTEKNILGKRPLDEKFQGPGRKKTPSVIH